MKKIQVHIRNRGGKQYLVLTDLASDMSEGAQFPVNEMEIEYDPRVVYDLIHDLEDIKPFQPALFDQDELEPL
jgi:hypothetical protein